MRGELIVRDLLKAAFPDVKAETERISTAALSDHRYIFVQATGGSAPHPGKVDSPTVEVICYGRGTKEEIGKFADEVTSALHQAWEQGSRTSHGYLARFAVALLPSAQSIPGLPQGVQRFSGTYAISTRPFME